MTLGSPLSEVPQYCGETPSMESNNINMDLLIVTLQDSFSWPRKKYLSFSIRKRRTSSKQEFIFIHGQQSSCSISPIA